MWQILSSAAVVIGALRVNEGCVVYTNYTYPYA